MELKDVPTQINNASTDVVQPLTLDGLKSALKELESMGFTIGRRECHLPKHFLTPSDISTSLSVGEMKKDLLFYIYLKYYGMWQR